MGDMGVMGNVGDMGDMGDVGNVGNVCNVGDVDVLGGIGTRGIECDNIALLEGSAFYLLLIAQLAVRGAKPFCEPCFGIVYGTESDGLWFVIAMRFGIGTWRWWGVVDTSQGDKGAEEAVRLNGVLQPCFGSSEITSSESEWHERDMRPLSCHTHIEADLRA